MANRDLLISIAERLMKHPASPYHETAVRAEAETICREHGLDFKRDTFGNLLVKFRSNTKTRMVAFAAHLDHPGFVIIRKRAPRRFLAEFRGGVSNEFFKTGIPLRLMPGAIPAVLGKKLSGEKRFEVQTKAPTKDLPSFAVWELPDFVKRENRIHGRACDDLIGAAAVLATLIELKKERVKVNVLGILSRAEEIGFHGAIMVAQSRSLPADALVISLETSRELPPIKIGSGVIIRVGDRTSIFDSEATRYLTEVAASLGAKDPTFEYQRALMSGGTCEATAFQEFGYQTAAVCVGLGNYHNCASKTRIAAEFVDADDAIQMVELLADVARQMPNYGKIVKKLPDRLRDLGKIARTALKKSA